jgi:hypothetical protein
VPTTRQVDCRWRRYSEPQKVYRAASKRDATLGMLMPGIVNKQKTGAVLAPVVVARCRVYAAAAGAGVASFFTFAALGCAAQ